MRRTTDCATAAYCPATGICSDYRSGLYHMIFGFVNTMCILLYALEYCLISFIPFQEKMLLPILFIGNYCVQIDIFHALEYDIDHEA